MDGNTIRSTAGIALGVVALVAGVAASAIAGSWHDLDQYTEPFHKVGAAHEVPLGDGGQGDCVWGSPQPETLTVSGLNPPAFYRDQVGTVHLVGVAEAVNGPGGDASCGGGDEVEDLAVFKLPPSYRPENIELATGGGHLIMIVPDEGATIGGMVAAPGSVIPLDGFGLTVLDGITFRAAGPGTRPISSDPQAHIESVHELKHELDD
ncbi:MAG: hypothetical protein ACJ75R_10780 [Solirubrobacterales bacterium]